MTGQRFAVCVSLLLGAALIPLRAQVPGGSALPKFRSSLDMVTIQASVRDTRGRTVGGLQAEDFEVRDNGQVRPVVSLRADRQSPVSLAILVDVSGSMRLAGSREMARFAYESILAELRPQRDEAALFTFDSSLDPREGFTKNIASLSGALNDMPAYGTTALYDAAAAAARKLSERSATHKALIILTDGIDTASRLTAPEVSGLASSIDVPVYVIATVSSADQRLALERTRRSGDSDDADLRDLAEWTGGHFVFASTLGETGAEVISMVSELRQQYLLAIEAASAREWHRLDVRVKGKAATVKARSGYFGG
ncbi:MAG: VWA domain-containing protein [Acidobacteriota bacterium]